MLLHLLSRFNVERLDAYHQGDTGIQSILAARVGERQRRVYLVAMAWNLKRMFVLAGWFGAAMK